MIRQRLVLQPQQIEQIHNSITIPKLFTLTSEQQNYLYKVLRLKVGAEFTALDGRGSWWIVILSENLGKVEILAQIPPIPDLQVEITLAIAMPKNGMEEVIRQATELGVSKIMPLWSDRTVIRPQTRIGASKLERWLKIAQEISEQSYRLYVPEIYEPQTFIDLLEKFNNSPNDAQINGKIGKYICATTKPTPHLLNSLLNLNEFPTKIVILTGAEGGWTETETALAIAYNFQPISLGDRILAAITAPVVALSIVSGVIESQFDLKNHKDASF
jgi:16S rRNA (uracil1498-N3)-methyltransferase